jgi:hypothetical protein
LWERETDGKGFLQVGKAAKRRIPTVVDCGASRRLFKFVGLRFAYPSYKNLAVLSFSFFDRVQP